jgi:FPC/CPF motif-containing protein YcgG
VTRDHELRPGGDRDRSEWLTRVILRKCLGIATAPAWLERAYNTFHANVTHAAFPCFFGTNVERRREMFYSFVSEDDIAHLPETMATFIALSRKKENERNNFAVFVEPPKVPLTHEAFRTFCWNLLQHLADRDPSPGHLTQYDPSDPSWEFSFADTAMFVVGCSPTYERRRSRNLGDGIVLLFQPRSVFIDPITKREIAPEARHQIRQRLRNWDGVPHHPDLGVYGDPANLEWKQYFISDDDSPETGICPLRTRSAAPVRR